VLNFDPKMVVCLDTETTGLGYDAEICQLAIIDYDEKKIFYELLKPTCPISDEAMKIHGITNHMVAGKNSLGYYWRYLAGNVLDGKIVLGFNITYDIRMLEQSIAAATRVNPLGLNKSLSPLMIFDVMMYYKMTKKVNNHYHLFNAAEVMGVDVSDLDDRYHDAMYDSIVTLRIFKALTEEEDAS
jgi:DNA polymerase III subunit epsilon